MHRSTTSIYTLSLHDALPIYVDDVEEVGGHVLRVDERGMPGCRALDVRAGVLEALVERDRDGGEAPITELNKRDRKSTRLNSSHGSISYAVFCLKKKKTVCEK